MTLAMPHVVQPSPAYNYHLLRHALEDFGKNLSQLNAGEHEQVRRKADKSLDLESRAIASPEAQGLVISAGQLDRSVAAVAARYPGKEAFERDLGANGLDLDALRQALYRELIFDAVMQRVATQGAEVNDTDVQLFYQMHHQRFETPEQRTASHILITLNPAFAENTRERALHRMEQLVDKLAGRANRFQAFAQAHSECPTAMEGGRLGDVARGQLFPQLDAVLFQLHEGQISSIVESEMGFHILWCEKIKPAKRLPLSKVAPKIREVLQQRQQRNCQKNWLAQLPRTTQPQGAVSP